MKKRSVMIAGHPTSVSLEEEFWDALKSIAQGRGLSVNALIEDIDRNRSGNLSSAIRVHVLNALLAGGGTAGQGQD
ncbi:ribbon-helix-helix domain-containing protein [Azospirillum griseum]|uniref:Aryl-sulfate sulfotransferase n=1 Tax=Azospirillum griseum TaxID=2496639 RepID=A0A431VCI5_9PROT|nr:ribbon-helix-helix domain-containing protein [Azospirillum griseum]RTR16558.1 aryl-sulfate sulfotransferase [Azospirillum griseum]